MTGREEVEPMELLRKDVALIVAHMTDHDILIRANTLLEGLTARMEDIQKLAAQKADEADLEKMNQRLERLQAQVDESRAHMNRMIGIGLAVQAFITIIFGLISLIHK